MEPNRLENEFKKKLEQRTIQPSEMAWDRLDAMLSVTEEKRKPKRTWMYIAASFLGFLLVGTLFLKQDGKTTGVEAAPNNAVVNAEAPTPNQDAYKTVSPAVVVPHMPKETQYHNEAQQIAGHSNKAVKQGNKREIVKVPAAETATVVPAIENAVAVTATQEIKESDAKVETESLLAQSIAENNVPKKKSSVKVDRNSLLSSVEGELNQSFKDKAIQGAIKNFNTVRSSLANRNHK